MMRGFNTPTLACAELRLKYKRRCRSVSEYIHYLWLVTRVDVCFKAASFQNWTPPCVNSHNCEGIDLLIFQWRFQLRMKEWKYLKLSHSFPVGIVRSRLNYHCNRDNWLAFTHNKFLKREGLWIVGKYYCMLDRTIQKLTVTRTQSKGSKIAWTLVFYVTATGK